MEKELTITLFRDVKARRKYEAGTTWEKICEAVANPKSYATKNTMRLLKMASFGDQRTERGQSLRSDQNVTEVFGLEGDYDGGEVTMEEGAAMLERMGIEAILFSSPRSTSLAPRWRVLCPLSEGKEPETRGHYMGLLNAVLGGILAKESFALSQAFYFGKTEQYGSSYKFIRVNGEPIDWKDGLLDPVFFKSTEKNEVYEVPAGYSELPLNDKIQECIDQILSNKHYYQPSLRLAALYFNDGMSIREARAAVKDLMVNHPNPNPDIGGYIDKVDNFLSSPEFRAAQEHRDRRDAVQCDFDQLIKTMTDKKERKRLEAEQANRFQLDIVEPSEVLRLPEFIIDGLISCGISVIAAYAGAGKTTAITSLAMRATGLIRDEFEPKMKRKVLIFTEHSAQIEEIIHAMVASGACRHSYSQVREMITLVNSHRLTSSQITECAQAIGEDYAITNVINGVEYIAQPWVILDTQNANLALEDENNSQEIGKMMATIKTEFFIRRNVPVSLVGHTAKALKHGDANSLSARGSGALEGDSHQVIYLSYDEETDARYIEIKAGKHRFRESADAIALTGQVETLKAINQFNQEQDYQVMFTNLSLVNNEARKAIKQATKEKKKEVNAVASENEKRAQIVDTLKYWHTVSQAGSDLTIPTKNNIHEKIGGRKEELFRVIDILISEGHLGLQLINKPEREKLREVFDVNLSNAVTAFYWLKTRDDQLLDFGNR